MKKTKSKPKLSKLFSVQIPAKPKAKHKAKPKPKAKAKAKARQSKINVKNLKTGYDFLIKQDKIKDALLATMALQIIKLQEKKINIQDAKDGRLVEKASDVLPVVNSEKENLSPVV